MEYTDIHNYTDLLRFIASQDVIAVSTSAGKDSQAMLDYVYRLAVDAAPYCNDKRARAGIMPVDRIVAIHADLGEVEWQGTAELARKQAEHYGVRFVICSRIGGVATKTGKTYKAGETFGSILDYAMRKRRYPSSTQRWCTSEFKRGPILKQFTALAAEMPEHIRSRRPVRILNAMGLRAEESPARAKKEAWAVSKSTRNQHITTWLPIHDWTVGQVWSAIHEAGCSKLIHPAYTEHGMSRLSCAFCIFAPKSQLLKAGHANTDLLRKYVSVERLTGFQFRGNPKAPRKGDIKLADILRDVEAGVRPDDSAGNGGNWNM
jgi:3'-phosphoadenosine 5'-phosphosulfate sulfotransferase (PAPS reductase)/FAD synthetase